MTTNQTRSFSVLTKDIARNPELLGRLKNRALRLTGDFTVTTHGDVTTVTAA